MEDEENFESFPIMKQISSPVKITHQIEALESRLSKTKIKTDSGVDCESISLINQLGLLYIKQGFLCFQQNKYEKAESYFSQAQLLIKGTFFKKNDPFLFLEVTLIQTMAYIYKYLGKEDLALKELMKFFERNFSSDFLASKSELISAGIELIFIMYGGLCLKSDQSEKGLDAVLQGIEYLQCFLRNHPWAKIKNENREVIIEKRKANLAYLYYLGSKLYVSKKNFSIKNLDNSLNFINKAVSLSKEVYGETAAQTLKYLKQVELLKKKIDFEKILISDLPTNFEEFCHGIFPPEKNISTNSQFESPEICSKSSRFQKGTSKFLKFQKKNEINTKNYPLRASLHRRNLTTLSTSTTNTQTPKTIQIHLSQISPQDIFETSRNLSDFMTKRPFTSKSKKTIEKTINFPSVEPKSSTPNMKTLTAQPTYKTLTSFSSMKSVSPEIPVRILKGQVLKHSISLKKSVDSQKNKDRRFSERTPVSHDEKKGGLSIFAVPIINEEEKISIMGSLSEHSESENESLENNSTSKIKSSQNREIGSNNTPKNEVNSLENNSMKNPKETAASRPLFLKKQTLEIPFLSRSRSKGGGSFSEKASSNSAIREDDQILLEKMGEIKRVKTEIMDKKNFEFIQEIKDGENVSKSISETNAASKFINKVFKCFFLRKFNKFTSQKIKEIEDGDSPILKAIEDMKVFSIEKSAGLSNIAFRDLQIEGSFPFKFYNEKGRICEILSYDLLLFKSHTRRLVIFDKENQDTLIPCDWFLMFKIFFKDCNANLGSIFCTKTISEVQDVKLQGLKLGLNILTDIDVTKITDDRMALISLIEIIIQLMKNSKLTRTCSGKILSSTQYSTSKYQNYLENERMRIHKLAVEKDVSLKNYFKSWGLEKIIFNPDISQEFSLFYENFNDKLPKLSNFNQIFSHVKKPSFHRRTISLKSIKLKRSLGISEKIDKKSQSPNQNLPEKMENDNEIKNVNNIIIPIEDKKNSPKIFNEKKESQTMSNNSSSPQLKDRDGISSIRDIQASNSQNSFISKKEKKLVSLIASGGSLRFSEPNPVSLKEIKEVPIKMPLESSPDLMGTEQEQFMDKINFMQERGFQSPRRKTMQYHSKNLNFPTIQSLFNLEDIEGSPKKLSPKQGFERLLPTPVIKESSAKIIEPSETIFKKSNSFKTDLLCNNKEFVEFFFNRDEQEIVTRYKTMKYKKGINNGIFVEKPFILEEKPLILVDLNNNYETVLVTFIKAVKNLVEMRVFYKKGNQQNKYFCIKEEELTSFAKSIFIGFLIMGNEQSLLEITYFEFFDVLPTSERDFGWETLIYFLKYKCLRKNLVQKIIQILNNQLIIGNEGRLTLKKADPLKKKVIFLSKKLTTSKNFSNFKTQFSEKLEIIKIKKVYLKFLLKNSAKYLRIEILTNENVMRLAFYDPLQGRKDYCLINFHQKNEFKNIQRVINQKSLKLKERILSQNLTYIQELVGKKLYVFREIRSELDEPKKQKYFVNLKLILLSQLEDDNLKNFFIKRVLYEVYKIKNLGKNYIKITIYKPNKHFSVDFQKKDQTLYKLEIYPFNKRFSLQKLIFNNEDFPIKDPIYHERAVLTYINHNVLNKLTYIKSMLYKRLVFPKFFSDPKYRQASFVEEAKFDKFVNIQDSTENLKLNDNKFLKLECLSYKICFQCIKKIGNMFGIITFKKHLLFGYWVIEIYFSSTNRILKCFLRHFDSCFQDFESSQTVKSWNFLMKKIKFVKFCDKYLLIIDEYRGIIRESVCDEVIVNKNYGLIMTEWIIEKIRDNNCLKIFEKVDLKKAKDFRIFLKIHFLTQGSVYNEKISLRDLIFSIIEFKLSSTLSHSDIIKIIKFYAKKLNNHLKMASDLRFFKEKAFKTRFLVEDPTLKPSIRFTKDSRIEGHFDKKYIILLEKVLTIRPLEIIGILWIVKEREFLIVVLQSKLCKKLVWTISLEDIKEKINCIESLMKLKLYVEAGNRILALVQNKILISSLLDYEK